MVNGHSRQGMPCTQRYAPRRESTKTLRGYARFRSTYLLRDMFFAPCGFYLLMMVIEIIILSMSLTGTRNYTD